MHPIMRTESRNDLIEPRGDELIEPHGDGASVGELVSQLAHEGKELAVVELQRLRLEVREQARRAVKTAAAGYLAIDFVALATLALSVGVFLALADAWDSYTAAAFVTSGILAGLALAIGLMARSLLRRMSEITVEEVRDLRDDGRAIRGA